MVTFTLVTRSGIRRPLAWGDGFELWDGLHLVAEFPMPLLMDLLLGHIARMKVDDRVRATMPTPRKPLAIVSHAQQAQRRLKRRQRGSP